MSFISDTDECDSNPCQNNGVCIDGIGEFSCSCVKGVFEGVLCEIGKGFNRK